MLKTSRYFTFALSVAAVLALAACEDKNTETKIDAPELNNSFAFGSETSKIKSVFLKNISNCLTNSSCPEVS